MSLRHAGRAGRLRRWSVFEPLFGGSGGRSPEPTGDLREKGPVAFELDLPSPSPPSSRQRRDRDLLVVQQHASDAVNDRLAGPGVDKGGAPRRPYAHLEQERLEELSILDSQF